MSVTPLTVQLIPQRHLEQNSPRIQNIFFRIAKDLVLVIALSGHF